MRIMDYIRDKAMAIGIGIVVVAFVVAILWAFGINGYLVAIIVAISVLGMLSALIWEYTAKERFYGSVIENIEKLDKQHLLSDMIDRPAFREGQIFYDALKVANKSMNDEILKYKILSEEYKEYIETWVHEVKTPIASGRLIAENNRNATTESLMEEIDKIDSFVEQALYYSKVSHLENDYTIKRCNLEDVVNEAIKKHSKVLIESRARITKDSLEVKVYADRKWTLFVLGQIIGNSIKYSKENLSLTFVAEEMANKVVLSIVDNGIGIGEKDIGKVFLKGFVGENGRRLGKSTGIGLYLCDKLCKRMGLSIGIASEYGKGTTVMISFPKSEMVDFQES